MVVNVQPLGWDPVPTLKSLNHKEDTLRLSKLRRGRGVDDIRHLVGVLPSPLKNPNEQKDAVSWSELDYGHDCSRSRRRVAQGSKRMFLELIHGLFIT